jgi:hypothetical protein
MSRPAFIPEDAFLETPFERRFQGLLRRAWRQRSWHVIAAEPGSGKTWGIIDLVEHSGRRKGHDGETRIPIMAIESPKAADQESALGEVLANAFGVVPRMNWTARRARLVRDAARVHLECLIIDDAHDLSLAQLAYLKEFADALKLPPYGRRISLCLVVAREGSTFPLQETIEQPEPLWRQFHERMDKAHPYVQIPNHTQAEVLEILLTLEAQFRPQFPTLELGCWAATLTTYLTHAVFDQLGTGRVRMNPLIQLVTLALERAQMAGQTNVTGELLQAVAEMMLLRSHQITVMEDAMGDPPWEEAS